jgi:hypothetical protein
VTYIDWMPEFLFLAPVIPIMAFTVKASGVDEPVSFVSFIVTLSAVSSVILALIFNNKPRIIKWARFSLIAYIAWVIIMSQFI